MAGKRPALLAQASAYFRLVAKADRAGNHPKGDKYRRIANSRIAQHHHNTAALRTRETKA